MSYTVLDRCLVCNSRNLYQYLSFGMQPAANNLQKEVRPLKTYPLEVRFCQDCTHNQLSVAVDPKELYTDYKYVSGTTETLKRHFEELVDELERGYPNLKGSRHCDIGGNDATLAETFKGFMDSYVVDPAENLQIERFKKGIPSLVEFWTGEVGERLQDSFSLITAFNVFAHNLNPKDFLQGCKKALKKDGLLVIQFPYALETFTGNQDAGQCYHEHINYFSVLSFKTLVNQCGFGIEHIEFFPEIHAGSIRIFLKVGIPDYPIVNEYIQREEEKGLQKLETYLEFAKNLEKQIEQLYHALSELTGPIYAYGASAKSSTLFNMAPWGIKIAKLIKQVVDDNHYKLGLYCPGSNLRVIGIDELPKQNINILLTVHNFKREVKNRLKKVDVHGKIVHWIPKVEVETI